MGREDFAGFARDRAFAELARARGWVSDVALDRALSEASGDGAPAGVERRLRAAGLLTEEQAASLWEAVDGVDAPASGATLPRILGSAASDADFFGRPRPAAGSGAFDATIRAPSSGSVPAAEAASRSKLDARRAPGVGAADATLTPSSPKAGDSVARAIAAGKTPEYFGPYRLMRELGRGGMGVVYRAMHVDLRREVALKVMLAGGDEDDPDTQRFRREAALVAKLGRHPHLVSVHEIGREDERLFFTMDYVDGRSANQRVEEEGAYPPREAAAIVADIAGALQFVHEAGVLHRDVKPHNVLIDRQGKAFLGDFGLAKDASAGGNLTVSGTALGTPAYMAPEIAARGAKAASPRSEVYSLGATLYEMIAGKAPFTGLNGLDLIRAVAQDDPVPPRTLRPDLHPDLDVVIQKAMDKDPERRYASAAEFEADLRRFLNGEGILARPLSRGERWRRKAKRHLAVLAAGALALAVLGAVGGWSLTKWVKDARAREAAARAARERAEKAAGLVDRARPLISRAESAAAAGNLKLRNADAGAAAALLEEAAGLAPDDAAVRYELGRALKLAGRTDEATAAFERAVERNPNHSFAWFEHGLIAVEAFLKSRGAFLRYAHLERPNEFGFRSSSRIEVQGTYAGGSGKADEALRVEAARDFERAVATGAAKEHGEYGRGMLLHFEGKNAEALEAMDRAVALNPYFVPALVAQAEIREFATKNVAEGLPWRRRLHELRPGDPDAAYEYAMSLAAVGQRDEAKAAIDEALAAPREFDWLVKAAYALCLLGEYARAEALGRRLFEEAKTDVQRQQAVYRIRDSFLYRLRFEDARRILDEHASVMDRDAVLALKGSDYSEEGKYGEAIRHYRQLKPDTWYYQRYCWAHAFAEFTCGNTAASRRLCEFNLETYGTVPMAYIAALLEVREDDAAMAFARKMVEDDPGDASSRSNLAGALFLRGEYGTAMATLEEAFMRSPVPDRMKEQVKVVFVGLKEKAQAAKTPAEAGRVVESMAGMITIALAQGQAAAEGAGAGREALRSIWWCLQEFYWRHGLLKESYAAGQSYLAIRRHGNILYKQARTQAARGKTDAAVRLLREAMEQGFDEGARLDGEKAFEALRTLPEFQELRGRCR
jgi:tetratricopeptide (TPR) repeat protein